MRSKVMDASVEELRGELTQWAARQPGLRRLWIYGSRALGTHRPDSDLDVAFEIERPANESAVENFHEHTLPMWRIELAELFGLTMHLEAIIGDASNVAEYVSNSGVLVYERNQPTCR